MSTLRRVFGTALSVSLCLTFASAWAIESGESRTEFDAWSSRQAHISVDKMLANISPADAAKGAVIAAPSKSNPDYFRHWIRDAGLTMNLVVSMYENAQSQKERDLFFGMLLDYTNFSRQNQTTANPSGGLGEPLFYADGSPFNKGWGRPQNDGPGIRAFVLTRWAMKLLDEGKEALVREKLYDSVLPARTVIKDDLEYVAHRWEESNFDLWEEIRGHHFYTRLVQRKALLEGAKLAERLGDPHAAGYYRMQARLMEEKINSHWHWSEKFFMATLGRDGGIDYKSGHDASTILGILHGDTHDGFLPVYDDRALATAEKLASKFKALYPINRSGPGIAIGRYPEDVYDGNGMSEGNPWILLTNGFAEYYYRVAKGLRFKGEIAINDINIHFYQTLPHAPAGLTVGQVIRRGDTRFDGLVRAIFEQGDSYLKRTRFHTAADGSMSEQMNRHIGYLQGAPNLTWSHASFIVAFWERSGF